MTSQLCGECSYRLLSSSFRYVAIDYVGGALSTGGWCCSSQQQQQQLSIAPADDDRGSSVESRCCYLHQRFQMSMILGDSVGKLTANSGAWASAEIFTRGHPDGSQLCSVHIIRGSQPIVKGRSPHEAYGAAAGVCQIARKRKALSVLALCQLPLLVGMAIPSKYTSVVRCCVPAVCWFGLAHEI